MKTILFLLLVGVAVAARAQSFSINSSVVGAGGTSSGGGFTVTGTTGEPATSPMSGGSFAIASGFWSVVGSIAMPDAPTLFIEPVTEDGNWDRIRLPIAAGTPFFRLRR